MTDTTPVTLDEVKAFARTMTDADIASGIEILTAEQERRERTHVPRGMPAIFIDHETDTSYLGFSDGEGKFWDIKHHGIQGYEGLSFENPGEGNDWEIVPLNYNWGAVISSE